MSEINSNSNIPCVEYSPSGEWIFFQKRQFPVRVKQHGNLVNHGNFRV